MATLLKSAYKLFSEMIFVLKNKSSQYKLFSIRLIKLNQSFIYVLQEYRQPM